MLEVEVDGDIEVIVNTNVEVTAGNMNVAIIEDTNDIEVTVNRQEYVITGDEIYIPKRFEDAPTWMQELITQVVDTSISAQIQDLNGISQSLESMIDAMEVAKNTYELSVISSNDIDERINTAVTTLNSSMNDADATILEVAQTRVTPEEASAITVDVITAELAKTEAGTLGATVSNLQTAVANEEEARSTSIEILTSSIEGAFDANATAMNYLNTYVGLDEVGASTGTGLSGYLEGSTGIIGEADSKVVNNVYVDALGNAKSKFEYGSTVSVNGVINTAGFGLSNSTGTGIGSEFWINAAKFKFTNNNKTGSKAPFTIDATGTVPEITFNGKVSFNNVTDYTPPDISGTINNNNDVFAQRLGYLSYADMVAAATAGQTIISGGYLRTNLIQAGAITANQINTVGLIAENISANTISGKTITGGTISGSTISGNTISGNTISGGTVTGTSIIGGSISGTTGTFSGEMTVGKFGNADMTISNGIAYIPIIAFDSIELSTFSIYDGSLKYLETTGPLLRSTCSFQITGVGSIGAGEQLFVYYSVNNGGTWVEFANFTSSSSSFTIVFSASGVSAVANSRIRIRIASQGGSFHGSIIVSNFS